jgi:hypothetical protein
MKGITIALLLIGFVTLSAVSIYQIQWTTNPGIDNTYPSTYTGRIVSVEGIVTAVSHKSEGFFISEQTGGPWRGIFIKTNQTAVSPGDKVALKGTVAEYYGMTCIQDIKAISIIDRNLPIPMPSPVTTGQIITADQAEAYEGTLVKFQNSTYTQRQAGRNVFSLNDGTGSCQIGDNIFFDKSMNFKVGDNFNSVIGIVCYGYGVYTVNPRSRLDITVTVPVFHQNRSWGKIKSIYK